jgi:hypothetical protein
VCPAKLVAFCAWLLHCLTRLHTFCLLLLTCPPCCPATLLVAVALFVFPQIRQGPNPGFKTHPSPFFCVTSCFSFHQPWHLCAVLAALLCCLFMSADPPGAQPRLPVQDAPQHRQGWLQQRHAGAQGPQQALPNRCDAEGITQCMCQHTVCV